MAKAVQDSGDGEDARRLERAARSTRPTLARMVEDAGAAAVAVHGRTAAQSYTGESDWTLIGAVAEAVGIPVFGSGDCVEPGQIVERLRELGVSGVLVGRGALRNPVDLRAGRRRACRRAGDTDVPLDGARASSCSTTSICCSTSASTKRRLPARGAGAELPARRSARRRAGRERWVINKLRALGSWYTKGLDGGSQLRVAINSAESIAQLRDIIRAFFFVRPARSSDQSGRSTIDSVSQRSTASRLPTTTVRVAGPRTAGPVADARVLQVPIRSC